MSYLLYSPDLALFDFLSILMLEIVLSDCSSSSDKLLIQPSKIAVEIYLNERPLMDFRNLIQRLKLCISNRG